MSTSREDRSAKAVDRKHQPPGRRSRRIIWFSVAVLASLLSFFLAWPWSRDFSYWAESRAMWVLYFSVGFLLAIYVFYAFFSSMRTLFAHDEIDRAERAARAATDDEEGQP